MRWQLVTYEAVLRLSVLPAALALGSCEWGAQIKKLEDDLQSRMRREDALQSQINELRSEQEKSVIEQSCKNPRVLKFLQDCKKFLESSEGHECNKLNVEQALKYMMEEKHVLVRLHPDKGLDSMAGFRRSQFTEMLHPTKLKSISSVLIVAQPQDDKPEHGNEALVLGRRLRNYLHEAYRVPEQAIYRPLLISCRGKSQMLDLYANQVVDDKPDFAEPQGKAPRVALWVFRLDCGNVATPDLDSAQRQPPGGPRSANAAHGPS